MTPSTSTFSTDADRIWHRCAKNMKKPAAFTQVHPRLNDFSSNMDQHCVKLAGMASERACFGRLWISEKSIYWIPV
ncbi:hypothetical protein [Desulfosarcina ovata]|uniref:hypothetical protein n=1 Tax=Desulfosarcina ovata TaxID=83564 RepID=UPI0012D3349F|nr:hypothetical protein [Desulfosarcina ovata]